ncbi:protein of unknown function [Methylorubrum extorquens DM4]|uniref:Uncharacterized protein n=1 Tax=Methylorubrum extorquens (strain DSM 6343 / CIP 106787 / DM4) TaxID=661410 RepID=C7CCA9_METED|nr:protein of unknown function [Methylorubrum extorquens DM4]
MVLRVRAQDGRHVQTANSAGDGLFERSEWEGPVNRPEPDKAAIAETPLADALGKKVRLTPTFTVTPKRRTVISLPKGL